MTRKDEVYKKVMGSNNPMVTLKEGWQNSPLPFVDPCCEFVENEARMGPTDCTPQTILQL